MHTPPHRFTSITSAPNTAHLLQLQMGMAAMMNRRRQEEAHTAAEPKETSALNAVLQFLFGRNRFR